MGDSFQVFISKLSELLLDESIVKNVYVELFFSSDLGKLVLQSTYGESAIPHITKQDLEEISIPIPELSEQETIIQTKNRLDTLQAAIIEFEKELSLSPKSAYAVQSKIEGMLDDLNVLSDAGRIRAIIRRGESKIIEFKQTLSLDIRTKTKEKYIEKSALKEIIAFLNTEGGTLLIGVTDDGYIEGIQEEIAKFYKNTDKFLLHFKNLLKEKIGEKFYPFIDYKVVTIDEKQLLFVECIASSIPCFYEDKEFFIRTNPATDLLEGTKMVEYIKIRFQA